MTEQRKKMLLQSEQDNSPQEAVVEEFEKDGINLLPTEILGKILSHLSQPELVQNRGVCSYWKDTIDEHIPMKVVFRSDDKFLDRKLQLRIRNCEIFGFPVDSTNISFSYPQTIRIFKISTLLNEEILRPLLNQVKPYVHFLNIEFRNFHQNIFTPPNTFPSLRELRINQYDDELISLPFNFHTLLSQSMPLIKRLYLRSFQPNLPFFNEIYLVFFNFLAAHRKSIKSLYINIQFEILPRLADRVLDLSEIFELPNEVKRLLYNGELQLEELSLVLPLRLIPIWAPIIARQKNLIDLSITSEYFEHSFNAGIPFDMTISKIQPSFATLSKLNLRDISSLSLDGTNWVPLDCSVFREIVNLSELSLFRGARSRPSGNEGARIVNLDKIPLANLKKLNINLFVCDSGELQTIVENAPLLEDLNLVFTLAPSVSPNYASFGVHGGIIQKFFEKPNKKIRIDIIQINISNEEENEKLNALSALFPESLVVLGHVYAFFHDFSSSHD